MRKCPACNELLRGSASALLEHFDNVHGRPPTYGEAFRYCTGRRKGKRIYQGPLKRHYQVVSGGLPSLGRR